MSKSIRRNYRNKNIDSDDDTSSTRCNVQNNEKNVIETHSILSFGDELEEDIDSFKGKKSSQSKKLSNKVKEPRKTNQKVPSDTAILHNDLDIYVQNNLKLNIKPVSPINIIEDIREFYESGSSNIAVDIIQKGDIPDAAAIDHVKKQRELAKRQIKAHESSSDDDSDNSHNNFIKRSYVLSNEDDINPDDCDRMAMVGQTNNFEKDRQITRNNFLSVEHGSDRDSDQENEWESRQLQKAINKNIHQVKEVKKIDWQLYSNDVMDDNVIKSSVLFELNSISLDDLTVSKLTDLLTERREEINESKLKNNEEIYVKQQTMVFNEEKATLAKSQIPILELKYNCFNNFRKYIAILVECFDEKMEQIVYLEKKFLKIHKERSDKLIKRNRQDVQDQFDEIKLSSKSSAIQSTYEMSNRLSRISDRESRRLRRIRARENVNFLNHYEGLSSDDEEPKSAISSRQNEMEQIKSDAHQLFSDTDSEYWSIENILGEFLEVKKKFEIDYKDAYINGFLSHILSPLIRLELMTWNPLTTPHFHKWNWFKSLVEFTKISVGKEIVTDISSVEYGDLKIIPSVFDKIVVPKLTEWISIWNPLSKSETQNLVKFISKLVSQIPTFNDKNKNVKDLIKAIVCRCNECICEDISIPCNIEQYKENPSGQPFQFFQHQLWSAIKTFSNIMMFHEIVDPNLLCKLAIEGILNNYIITGLVILTEMNLINDVITKVTMIKYVFPEEWISKSEELNLNLSDELSNLIWFITKFGSTNKKDKTVVTFAFSILDHFNISRVELLGMIKD